MPPGSSFRKFLRMRYESLFMHLDICSNEDGGSQIYVKIIVDEDLTTFWQTKKLFNIISQFLSVTRKLHEKQVVQR